MNLLFRFLKALPLWIFLSYIVLAVLAQLGWIAQDFDVANNQLAYLPPSSEYWFGTDIFGRSVLARSIHAAKNALLIGFFATSITLFVGVFLGSIAGYTGGLIDDLVVWLFTTFDSIPYILLLSAFAFVLGPGMENLFLALGLTSWVTLCKIVRVEVLKARDADYVLAAKAQGLHTWSILFRHIFPNIRHLILVQAGLVFIAVIKIEVILSFLGLGVVPGSPSWGLMLDDAKQEITRGIWWNMACATLSMFGLFFSLNYLIEKINRR